MSWHVSLSGEAERELLRLFTDYPELRPDILARLKALEEFPPEKWFVVSRFMGRGLFKAETGQMIRISGEAHFETRTVQVTRVTVVRKRI